MRTGSKKFFERSVPETILIAFSVVIAIILVLFIASFFIDKPLASYLQKTMNKKLKGYSVSLPAAHFQIIGFSLTLRNLKIMQNAHPDPPVIFIHSLTASVQWRELLSGNLVADLEFDKPQMHINLAQLKAEARRKTKIKNEGWQQAFESIYPLDINSIRFRNGDIVYIDANRKLPLHIKHLNFVANNIRNIHYANEPYPSPIRGKAVIFGTGRGYINGKADFLRRPFMGIETRFNLKDVPLDRLKSITARKNVKLSGGIISTDGVIEYAPNAEKVHVYNLAIKKVKIDYLHMPQTARIETEREEKIKRAAKQVGAKSKILIKLDKMRLTDSELGYVNMTKNPAYRVFVSNVDLTIDNFSNHFSQGVSNMTLKGLFMGNGITTATARFRPEVDGPDFQMKLAIKNTLLPSMNKILLAYGKFNVVRGFFSLYMDVHVKNRMVNGYVKPFFTDMKVYDRRTDKNKNLFKKLYYMLVGGVAHILENPRSSVATKTTISGPTTKPQISTWRTIIMLFKNAFFHMILPGFDRSIKAVPARP